MTKKAPQEVSKELDQYYTDPQYARAFYDHIQTVCDFDSVDLLLEPSAGTGSFYSLMDPQRRLGLDLDPRYPGVAQCDFFDYVPPPGLRVATIGNPPFGKNSSLAIKFFNRSAEFSDWIAFIVPRTFRKASVINRLHPQFHLVSDQTVPDNSFIYCGRPYDVWCCAQIWQRRPYLRTPVKIIRIEQLKAWFEIVDKPLSDFAVQRVGGRAGLIRTHDRLDYSDQSHYFIKSHNPLTHSIFASIDYSGVKFNTAGNPSVSPSELCELFVKAAQDKNIRIEI